MFDAFRIGVSIYIRNEATVELRAISRELSTIKGKVDLVSRGFEKWGHVSAIAGATMLGVVGKIAEASARQLDIENRLITAGVKRADVNKMVAESQALALSKGDFSSTQYLQMLAEMRNTIPELSQSLKLAPVAADFMTDIKLGDPNADVDGTLQDALKTIAIRGRLYKPGTKELDVPGILNELDWMGRETRFTNGQQNPASMRQFAAQMGPEARSMSAAAFYGFGAELANTMRANKAGTAVSSLFQQLIGGTMPRWVAENLIHGGLLNGRDVHFKNGHASLGDNALVDRKGFEANPFTWLSREITSYAARMHESTQDATYQILGRATTQRLGSDAVANIGELSNAFSKMAQAWGVEDTARQARGFDPANLQSQAWSSIATLGADLGKGLWSENGVASTGLKNFVNIMHRVDAWVTDPKHTAAVSEILRLSAYVGGALAIGGFISIAGAAFLAMTPVLIPLAGGALLAAAGLKALGPTGIKRLGEDIRSLAQNVVAFSRSPETKAAIGRLQADFWGWIAFFAKLEMGIQPAIKTIMGEFASFLTFWGNFSLGIQPIFKGIIGFVDGFASDLAAIGSRIGGILKWFGVGSSGTASAPGVADSSADAPPVRPYPRGLTMAQGQSWMPPPRASAPAPVVVVSGHVHSTITNPSAMASGTAAAMNAAMSSAADAGFSTVNRRQVPIAPSQTGLR